MSVSKLSSFHLGSDLLSQRAREPAQFTISAPNGVLRQEFPPEQVWAILPFIWVLDVPVTLLI